MVNGGYKAHAAAELLAWRAMMVSGADLADVDVAIVGAGAAGLAAGRHIRSLRPDMTIQLFEAGARIGGRALTVAAGPHGTPVDLGCGWLHGGRDNAWSVIAARTGFTIDRALSSWDGGGRDLGLGAADDKQAEEALARFFERADSRSAEGSDVSLATLLEPNCRWNGLLGAIGTFVNGVELDQASALDYRRYEPGRGPDWRVREGYGRLIQFYGVDLPTSLETRIERVDHGGGRGIVLTSARGVVKARYVIVTVPTSVLAHEAIRFDPPLHAKTDAANQLPLGIADKLFLGIPDNIELPDEHHLMGSAEDLRTASYHVRPFGRAVIECYFGGQLARDLEREGERAFVAFARKELARHFGRDLPERLQPLAATHWAMQPHIGGSYSYAKPGGSDARTVLARPVDDRLFFAGEACSRHRYSTAHGAYETGVAAAEAVVGALARRPS